MSRHGRTFRDCRNLSAHLLKDRGAVVRIANSIAPDLSSALDDMLLSMQGSRATSAFLHIYLSPSRQMTEKELRKAAMIVLRHFDAEDHPAVFVIHEKKRVGGDGDSHCHLVVGRVGPDGNVLSSGFEKIRLETACRILEFELGETPTLGRHHASAVRWLREHDRADVANWLESAHGVNPEKPTSVSSPKKRQAVERQGVSLAAVRKSVRHAWEQAGTPQDFTSALSQQGYEVVPGDKPGVWVVRRNGIVIGSLDRVVRSKRKDVDFFMRGYAQRIQIERVPTPSRRQMRRSRMPDPTKTKIDLDELRRLAEAYADSIREILLPPANPSDARKRLESEIRAVSARLSTKGASGKPIRCEDRPPATYDTLEKTLKPGFRK